MNAAAYRSNDDTDLLPEDEAPRTLRSGELLALLPTLTCLGGNLPSFTAGEVTVKVEKLHPRSRDFVVAAYIGNTTRYIHHKKAGLPGELDGLFQAVKKGLTTPEQITGSKHWSLWFSMG